MTAAPVFMQPARTLALTGDSLLNFVNDKMTLVNRGELTRTEMIKDAGYITNGAAQYVDFYTELLRAKGITPVTDKDVENTLYDDLDADTKDLYDALDNAVGEKWDHEQVMAFIDELDNIGITTAEQFDESFEGIYDSDKEFAEYWVTDVMNAQIPECVYNCVDWDAVYNCELRYDFNCIEFEYDNYYFRNL
jgi:hypothetical protein